MQDHLYERGGLPTFATVILAIVLLFCSVIFGYFFKGKLKGASDNDVTSINSVSDNVVATDITGKLMVPTNTDNVIEGNAYLVASSTTSTSIGLPAMFENKIFTTQNFSFDLSPYYVQNDDAVISAEPKYVSLPKGFADKISWIGFYTIDKMGFFDIEHQKQTVNTLEEYVPEFVATTYNIGGYFEYNNKKGLIVFADVDCLDCMGGGGQPYSMFVLYDSQIVLLEKLMYSEKVSAFSSLVNPLEHIITARVSVDRGPVIPYLEFPSVLYVHGSKLTFVTAESAGEYPGKLSIDNNIWSKMNKIGTAMPFGDVFFGNGRDFQASLYQNFYILGRDQRVRTYTYKPFFVDQNGLIDVIYQDGAIINNYRSAHAGGCGLSATHVILPDQIDVDKDLKEVGKTVDGISLLGLKDSNHKLLRDFYESIFYPQQGKNMNYENFIKERPAVFWIDPFSRVIMFELNKFTPAAECGKPVIYLYPTTETKVKVDLEVNHFSYTEPEYGNGWEVLARPNGELTNLSDGKTYQYLFWEGVGTGEQPKANEGFVVARGEVASFLNEKLFELGLQGREISDFIEFWQPRMIGAHYYFVTFYGTNVMNQIAPLTIEPKPDSVIRVLMDYHPLKKPIMVKKQRLSHPPRHGFTVVEWGGVMGRE